jgi:tRNA dimethylallyltransferase
MKNHADGPIPVLILCGPTASGKTGILSRVCSARGHGKGIEIISADSMQVYRGMDIGTAKPPARERALIPHHLIDIRNPDEQFNAGDFTRLADEACVDIARRGALPVVSGGTGFYLTTFIMGLPETPPSNSEIRAGLRRELRETGAATLMAELARFDPVSAGRIHPNDEYRLTRALEVLRISGRPLSSFRRAGMAPAEGASSRPEYRFRVIGLSRPREELYRRIDGRSAAMFRDGLPEEVLGLFRAGYTPRDPGLRAIGYREFFVGEPAADPEADPAEGTPQPAYRLSEDLAGVQALVAQNSRRYAKRQMTFFASIPGVRWIDAGPDEAETAGRIQSELDDWKAGVHTPPLGAI